ncbi:hypothetical protein A1O7_04619 [Cladophialophora yegresii CBS 114405]|uniref:Methyltransferase domain-containing protein n=1 Tax=Cladophialophora yegresii CBS 114405 TaxID=1182544 RepID=W9W7G1_9EURO|nr:uncharacterized protein A1O7_04619 [Cladophialophora yegresii CBS 114405]EXJ60466.1 hypothetical protein A1O7_04619 [Cladophialophora yegresii CBS 114405]
MTHFSRHRPGRLRLPLDPAWKSEDEYVQSVLTFATTSDLFRNLCGGVHILDFLTREPDLYTTVLPPEWRDWFEQVDIDRVLDLLMRDDLARYVDADQESQNSDTTTPRPPASLVDYISTIRKHSLKRTFTPPSDDISELPPHVAVGMKTKKVHEVTNIAAYVGQLCDEFSSQHPDQEPLTVVDFGSGQNYLGRTLASPPYNKQVVAIEKRHHNITGAKSMDVHAKLAKKEKVMRNKKEWKRQLGLSNGSQNVAGKPPPPTTLSVENTPSKSPSEDVSTTTRLDSHTTEPNIVGIELGEGKGSMTYVEHDIQDGYLEHVIYPATPKRRAPQDQDQAQGQAECCPADNDQESSDRRTLPIPPPPAAHPPSIVISLHSCGNLTHHALRSLVLTPSIRACAVIGCCYNLLTERLGPVTYKLPQLRPNHPRLAATGGAYDPHGFPMSKTLEDFVPPSQAGPDRDTDPQAVTGVRLNITARMMAVQAPFNWGPLDSELFFRRHFYRTLLQKILLDLGVVKQCPDPAQVPAGGSITGRDDQGTPLIVGSLPKACFVTFRAYVRGALAKLRADPTDGDMVTRLTQGLSDEMVDAYEARFAYARKNLAVIWSLMAFSAGVVESIIVTDRWLFLREQEGVRDAWVDVVFDYTLSPRNFVVVGVK